MTLQKKSNNVCLTVDPGDADGLKDGHEEKTHPTGCIVIEQLEDIHAPLQIEQMRGHRLKLYKNDPSAKW